MELRRNRASTSVRTEGGLLPSDLLEKIKAPDPDVPGLKDADFGLPVGERAREATTRSWNRLVGAWAALEAVRVGAEPSDPLVGPTRDRFLVPLFEELGFGRLPVARAVEIEGTSYPISHRWEGRVPVHLVGYGVALDSRTKGVRGAAGAAPHALVQEYLNRSDDALWGVVSNGRTLRLLRDSTSLTRQAYVEFDLEAIFEGELYADFALLWSVLHRSRFEGEKPADCLLERWMKKAADDGTRALDKLRGGVEKAIETLGAGFLATKGNTALVEALRSGEFDSQDFYRELLRLVYRLIFLFTAEDRRDEETGRELLLDPAAPEEAAERYRRYYSTVRLRSFASRRRGSRHPDLWVGLRRVVAALGSDGAPSIALPALGSFLFGSEACRHLDASELTNEALLDAVRAMATIEEDRRLRLVDYRNLGAEELGGVYEGLLELHPLIQTDANPPLFSLGTAAGNERKTTGSYYTPTSLINHILDTALDPVVDRAARGGSRGEAEAKLLELAIVDPAAGSGHFLIAAAHRLAKRLASIRTEEGEPAPTAVRQCLREVIARCIYGVDLNPMAVELCKVSLWLEALQPGKPLSFLDAHIKTGNSLLGTTPQHVADGVPDGAFDALPGDDKAVAKAWRARNRQEREGQQSLFEAPVSDPTAVLAHRTSAIDALLDDSPEAVRLKQDRHEMYRRSPEYVRSRDAFDAWCAAFVATKAPGNPEITTAVVRASMAGSLSIPSTTQGSIRALAHEYAFFHWNLEFPQVMRRGGFDSVIGNPPWERVKLQEREFFAAARSTVGSEVNSRARKTRIASLASDDPTLYIAYRAALRAADAAALFLRQSGRYPLGSKGDLNTYAVFTELARSLIAPGGRAGIIVPTGLVTDLPNSELFSDLVDRKSFVELVDFENRLGIFAQVNRAYKFSVVTLAGAPTERPPRFAFGLLDPSELEPDRWIELSHEDFRLFNPRTLTCPTFRSRRDYEVARTAYLAAPPSTESSRWFELESGLHSGSFASIFKEADQLTRDGWTAVGNQFVRGDERAVPLYEGKMFWIYDHRAATVRISESARLRQRQSEPTSDADHRDPAFAVTPYFWVRVADIEDPPPWRLAFKKVTAATNARTMICAVLPRCAANDSVHFVSLPTRDAKLAACMLAVMGSHVFDFVVRQKLGGLNLNLYVFEQLPLPSPRQFAGPIPWAGHMNWIDWLVPRVLELVYTAHDLEPFAKDAGWLDGPFVWDPRRRAIVMAELDAAIFQMYGLSTSDAEYVIDSFPLVRERDYIDGLGTTPDLVKQTLATMTAAIAENRPFVSPLG